MKDPTRVAVTSRSFSRHPILRAELVERFAKVTFNDAGAKLEGEALIRFLDHHEKAITALEVLNEAILSRLPQLKLVSKYGVGLDMIDLEAMRRHDKTLRFTPGVNRRSVAELALGFMLVLLHRVPLASARLREGGWEQVVGRQLSGRCVGIVGCGNVGKELVHLLAPFGCRILVNDLVDYADFFARHAPSAERCELEFLLANAHVVSLHVPLDHSTQNLLSAQRLSLMRADALLINTARGGIVDEGALKQRLQRGELAGAAFDVFGNEPPNDPELLALPNFLGTPHIGGSAEEAILAMGRSAIAGLED